ncbi:MAG: hypothetical protein JNN31_09275 [Dechloromonas sp.]|nr:hypothetical protein [Dechloromonas sp.]
MKPIHALSIALGPAESGLSDEMLRYRKVQARQTAFAFMPSLQRLFVSRIRERLVAEKGNLWLAFDIVPATQMSLTFDGNPDTHLIDGVAARQLREEYALLQDEASDFVIRAGHLISFAGALPQMDAADRSTAIESLPEDDRLAWEVMHRQPGRRISIDLGGETLSAQLPLLALYVPEAKTRKISARVSEVSNHQYKLTGIREMSGEARTVTLPAAMALDRPRRLPEPLRRERFLLQVAEEFGIRIHLEVRVILFESDLSPAYLEFRGLENKEVLQKRLQFLNQEP